MLYNFLALLAYDGPFMGGTHNSGAGEITTPSEIIEPITGDITEVIATATPVPDAGLFGGGMSMFIVWIIMFAGMYFLIFRPQRKREKQLKEAQSAIRTGDQVVTTGGLFGKVTDVGDDCFVIEFGMNRGVRIPVRKTDVLGVKEPKLTPSHKTD